MIQIILPWPHQPTVSAELRRVRSVVIAEKLPWQPRDAAMRESLVARGVMPAEWLSRAFKGRLPSFKDTDEFTPSFIHHDAMYVLMHDPARVLAAEAIARSIFAPLKPRFIWTTAYQVRVTVNYIYTIPEQATVLPLSTVATLAQGVSGTPTACRLRRDIASWDAKSFYAVRREAHPEYEPLMELGVYPWVIELPEHYIVSLLCAFNFSSVGLEWKSVTVANVNAERAADAVQTPPPFRYLRRI